MQVPTAMTSCQGLAALLLLLVFTSVIMKTYTPDAAIYTGLGGTQALFTLYGIYVYLLGSNKDIKQVHLIVMLGVATIIFGVSNVSIIEHELTTCRDITTEELTALATCNSATPSSSLESAQLSSSCVIATRVSLAKCVVGRITDVKSVSNAKAAGTGAAVIAIFQLLLVAGIELIVISHFWTHAGTLLRFIEANIVADAKAAEQWTDRHVYEPMLNALGYKGASRNKSD